MTFLAKLGKALAQGVAVITGVWPLVSQFFGNKAATAGAVVNDLSLIGGIVVQSEAFIDGPGTGAEKLAKATPLIANVVKTSEMVSGHQIQDEALFIQGCAKFGSGAADILNSLKSNTVQTTGNVITLTPEQASVANSVPAGTPVAVGPAVRDESTLLAGTQGPQPSAGLNPTVTGHNQ